MHGHRFAFALFLTNMYMEGYGCDIYNLMLAGDV